MEKLLTTACLFVVTTIALVCFIAPFVGAQEAKQSDREARKTYPDFALHVQGAMATTDRGPLQAAFDAHLDPAKQLHSRAV